MQMLWEPFSRFSNGSKILCGCVKSFILVINLKFLMFRYPVILEHFSLRPSSGGAGQHCGGDGVTRKLLFRDEVVLSVLTERRSTRPYGLKGILLLLDKIKWLDSKG